MGNVRVRVTGLVLLLAALTRAPLWRPLLIANAIVGAVYMCVEWAALARVGSCGAETHLPGRSSCLRLSWPANVALNLLFHGLLTLLALRALPPTPPPMGGVVLVLVAGLALVDLAAVYPTAAGIAPYVVAHVALTLALSRR